MIIAFTSGGQTGNQLMYAANMMATSIEYNVPYRNISFKAIETFEIVDLTQSKWLVYKKFMALLLTKYMYGIKKVTGRTPGINVFMDKEDDAKRFFLDSCVNGLNFFHCWPYLDLESLYKHKDVIRKIFKPRSQYLEEGKYKINEIRNTYGNATIVGVHIRRKDYKDFLGGLYYFDLEVYRKRMEEMSWIINKDIIFLAFSDESINKDLLIKEDSSYRLLFSGNSATVDLVMMSLCDYIIGPPSTFSGWASFWGNVPKHIMVNDNAVISALHADFGVYMIDVMDNETDDYGRKRLTYYRNGSKVDYSYKEILDDKAKI